MLFADCGPVYMKLCFVCKVGTDCFLKLLENELLLKFIDIHLRLASGSDYLIFAKISHYFWLEFIKSKDYDILKHSFAPTTEKILYSGHMNDFYLSVLNDLFSQCKLVKIEKKSIQLSIFALEFMHSKQANLFHVESTFNSAFPSNQIFVPIEECNKKYHSLSQDLYPYILANIIEGSSIYRVDSKYSFTRLGGSTFGATTFWALAQISCGYKTPDEAILEGMKGDPKKIDLSVGDIYGTNYEGYKLPKDLIASSFGNVKKLKDQSTIEKKDICRSLLSLFCICNSQLLGLYSSINNINQVILTGNPLQVLELMHLIQSSVNYSSKGNATALFSDYGPYLTLIGIYVYVSER